MSDYSKREKPNPPASPASGGSEGLLCPDCGYDLTGLVQDRCPECGVSFDRALLILQQQQDALLLPWETGRRHSLVRRILSTCFAAWLHPARYCDRIAQRRYVRVSHPAGLIAGVIGLGLFLCMLSTLAWLGAIILGMYWSQHGGVTLPQCVKSSFDTCVGALGPVLLGVLLGPLQFVSPLLSCALLSCGATIWFKEQLGRLRTIDLLALMCVPAWLWPCLVVLGDVASSGWVSLCFFLAGAVCWVISFYLAPRKILGMGRAGSVVVAAAACVTWGLIQYLVGLPF
ncbi:MAG TPA: hypothetical protein VMV94_05350 [Phycisphaerae bacterium]|nr:hypothetical protein [Phycisphaerae bacterium]